MQFLTNLRDKIVFFFRTHGDSRRSDVFLGALSFAESSFFPIPPDFFLMPLVAIRSGRDWFYLAALTTITSVLGGFFGYAIGSFLFSYIGAPIISFYHLQDGFQTVELKFQTSAFITIFLAGFTPIPYKVFTIAAGVFHVALFPFFLASFLGRGGRFFIVAYVMKRYGEKISLMFLRWFNLVAIVVAVIILLTLFYILF